MRNYEGNHPRLQVSIAPLSPDSEADELSHVTAEFLAQGKTLRLSGKASEKYVAD